MKRKPVVPRELAASDAEAAVDWYVEQGTPEAALGFVRALERAFGHLARHPGSGSLRIGLELGLHGLRSWRLKGFPHLVFYVERDDHVDVWRVLHERRDLPSWLDDPEDA